MKKRVKLLGSVYLPYTNMLTITWRSLSSIHILLHRQYSPDVEFCGYSAPHPSEPKIHLRVQMYGKPYLSPLYISSVC